MNRTFLPHPPLPPVLTMAVIEAAHRKNIVLINMVVTVGLLASAALCLLGWRQQNDHDYAIGGMLVVFTSMVAVMLFDEGCQGLSQDEKKQMHAWFHDLPDAEAYRQGVLTMGRPFVQHDLKMLRSYEFAVEAWHDDQDEAVVDDILYRRVEPVMHHQPITTHTTAAAADLF